MSSTMYLFAKNSRYPWGSPKRFKGSHIAPTRRRNKCDLYSVYVAICGIMYVHRENRQGGVIAAWIGHSRYKCHLMGDNFDDFVGKFVQNGMPELFGRGYYDGIRSFNK